MARFLRSASSVFAAASMVCVVISAISLGGAAFAAEPLENAGGCGTYTNAGYCSNPEWCTGPGNYCTEHATCPCDK